MSSKIAPSITSVVYRKTPTVKVYSNQGLLVRKLDYYRAQAEQAAEIRISLQRFNTTAQLKSSYDPRLSAAYLKDNFSVPNQQQITTLRGIVLQSKNVDAGMRISIVDCRGQPLWNSDSRATKQEFYYDVLRRVTAIYEKVDSKSALCQERFLYGDKQSAKGNNLIHRLLQCYDTAGLQTIKGYSLFGALLKMERQFVATHEAVDWPEQTAERTKLLEEIAYITTWQYNGLDEIITQTDAQNNLRSFSYNTAGQLSVCKLQMAQGPLQTIADSFCYAANGQLQNERLGNGVNKKYVYEEKTQRLQQIRSLRQKDQQVLQDLNYHYDPVGNIIVIIDRAQAIGFYANNKTQITSEYHYDSLYQLIIATDIESQQAGKKQLNYLIAYH